MAADRGGGQDRAADVGGDLLHRRLGEFVVREALARGGAAEVYLAEQPALARTAVLKVLRSAGQEATERFLREARVASRLDHPFAGHIYAFGAEDDGLLWIAMEHVRGSSLAELLQRRGPMTLVRLVPLFERLCEVVHAAHEKGIVHRDIKPENVMVMSRAGRLLPKLLDFGIARLAAAADAGDEPGGDGASDSADAGLSVTHRGRVIGSPRYMAPEQWTDPAGADARADIYALGALAYEALTGRPAFSGNTLKEVARAHARGLPASEGLLPDAVDAVLRRATARRPEARYGTGVELGAALRRAAGVAPARANLPELREAVREAVLSTAPQPIAEAVLGYEAARDHADAQQALAQAARAMAKYMAVIALAGRASVGDGSGDAEALAPLLGRLRGRPAEDDWLELTAALCRPYAERPELFPVPELVQACGAASAGEALPDLLARVLGTDEPSPEATERSLRALERALESLPFLFEYRLVVARGGRVESWGGPRRRRRSLAAIRGPELEDGAPWLLDAEGAPALRRWPLVQAAPPAPGAEDELFFFDGAGGAASRDARLVSLPVGFERRDDEPWTWLAEHFPVTATAPAAGAREERAPYRGLAAFSEADADWFFGREREVEAVANRLRVTPFLAVVGPSGVGKSSFVRAGVLPRLAGWRGVIVRPGRSPLTALVARLSAEAGVEIDPAELREAPDRLGEQLRAAAARDGPLMLVVDQFEELLTLCRDQDERRAYAEALLGAARSADELVRVVITLRDDFLIRAEQLHPLRTRLGAALQLLAVPPAAELVRVLTEPAGKAGYEFDDPSLPEEMAAEVADRHGALALLSFTAQRLWELRDGRFRRLRRKAYESMGGVGGALAQHAEATLASMSADERSVVRETFRHLATAEGTRAVLSRNELIELAGDRGDAEGVLESLLGARLLVSSEGEEDSGAGDRIEIVHEALLEAWPRLVAWRREDAESARLRDQLRAAARQWDQRGRPNGLLWRGDALTEYELWRPRYPGALTAVEESFAGASRVEAARGRRRRLLLVSAFAVLALSSAVLFWLNRQAQQQRRIAEDARAEAARSADQSRERLAALLREQGRQALLDDSPLHALVFLGEAARQGADDPQLRFLLARARAPLDSKLRVLRGHRSRVTMARFSADGRRIVTAGGTYDRTVKVWDAATGELVADFSGHGDGIVHLDVDEHGELVVSASADGTARVWSVPEQRELAVLAGDGGWMLRAELDAAGRAVLTSGFDGVVRLWEARTGELIRAWPAQEAAVFARFAPDGRVVVSGADGTARIFDGARELLRLRHDGVVWDARIDASGRRLVTIRKGEPDVLLWDARTGERLARLAGHVGAAQMASFDSAGARLATAGADGTVWIWDARGGEAVRVLRAHDGPVTHVAFEAGGERLLTASEDGTARLWDVHTGRRIALLAGHRDAVAWAEMDPAGERIVTAGIDGDAFLWAAADQGLIGSFTAAVPLAGALAAGKELVAVGLDGTLQRWSVDGEFLGTVPVASDRRDELGMQIRRVPDIGAGGRLAVVPYHRQAHLVELSSGRKLASYGGHEAQVLSAQLDRAARRVITAGRDGTARIWDSRSAEELQVLSGHEMGVLFAGFDDEGARAVTAGMDKTVRLWDARTGALLETLPGHTNAVNAAAFLPGNRLVTASSDTTLRIWDLASARVVQVLETSAEVNAVAVNGDGTLLASGTAAGQVELWSTEDGRRLAAYAHGGAVGWVAFPPGGDTVVSADGERLRRWDVSIERRSLEEILAATACEVPLRLAGTSVEAVAEPRGDCN